MTRMNYRLQTSVRIVVMETNLNICNMNYEENYKNVTEVAGLDIIAVEGKGLYATDGEYTWLLASEDYMQALPALEAQYPYDIDQNN